MIKRVLLKISGEALLCSDGKPVDNSFLSYLSKEIKLVYDMGVQVAVVVGGGNIFRGVDANGKTGLDRVTGDYMGMLGTVINSLALKMAFETNGMYSRVMTAIEINKVAEPFIRGRAIRYLEKKMVVIFGAGTGNPYFTTDTAAALRAAEIDAELLIKATNVDGLYNTDPNKSNDAVLIKKTTYQDAITNKLRVMDMTALTLCDENKLPLRVLDKRRGCWKSCNLK